jgi:hypothetical protein
MINDGYFINSISSLDRWLPFLITRLQDGCWGENRLMVQFLDFGRSVHKPFG